jgi:hypothetical protein
MRGALEMRACSGFGISIGTGNALRAILMPTDIVYKEDEERTPIEKVDIKQFSTLAVSWFTIIRNILSAMDSVSKKKLLSGYGTKDLINVAMNEIEIIESLVKAEGLQFILLAPKYLYVEGSFIMNKDDQNESMRTYRLADTLKSKITMDSIKYHNFKLPDNALLLSHINFDLLTHNKNMSVLESHTGNILNNKEFNKKYRVDADTSYLPFLPNLLFALSDKSSLLKPFPPKVKEKILSKLSSARITPRSTYRQVQNILTRDNTLQDYIKGFNNPY